MGRRVKGNVMKTGLTFCRKILYNKTRSARMAETFLHRNFFREMRGYKNEKKGACSLLWDRNHAKAAAEHTNGRIIRCN